MTLDEVKNYLRINYDDEDNFINLCLNGADAFLRGAVTDYDIKINNNRFKNQSDLVSLAIVQDMYDNRGSVANNEEKYKMLFQNMLLQMEYGTYE